MESITWILVFLGAIPVLMAAALFGIGVWGLLKKRPLVIAYRPIFWSLCVVCVVGILLVVVALMTAGGNSRSSPGCTPLLEVVLFLALMIALERQMSGYMILGVTDETFRSALIHALTKLDLPYEETISRILLKGSGAELVATVEPRSGVARIRMREREHDHYAREIVTRMKEYFEEHQGTVNNTMYVIWLVTGAVLIPIIIFIFLSIGQR